VKTPEEFAQVISSRKADGSWKAKPKKPASVIFTMIFAAVMLASAGYGCLLLVIGTTKVLQGGGSFLVLVGAWGRQLGIVALSAATLFACIKRPAWGRAVSIMFAVAFGALIGTVLAFPNPHPAFPIAPGAEQVGADVANVLIAVGIVAYVWAMLAGGKARAYFEGG
jgi:hypothetical protein